MPLGDLPDEGEAKAGAAGGSAALIERLEDPFPVALGDARSSVANRSANLFRGSGGGLKGVGLEIIVASLTELADLLIPPYRKTDSCCAAAIPRGDRS
jgi:hypothetical protein